MRFLSLALLLLTILTVGAARAATEADQSLRQTPVVRAVKAVAPAVVNINVARPQSNFWGQQRTVKGAGSGVIIDGKKSLVLTNAHVVESATQITVRLQDGREFEAELLGSDPDFDLAVLSLKNASNLPAITLGDSSDIQIGEPVIAIGNPYGYAHTVTTGVISAMNRSLSTKQGVFTDFIQTDAAINPGNSGGPLLNILGELIGINTAIHRSGEGIGFAIPINKARRVLDELLASGSVAPIWLGLYGQDLDQPTAQALSLDNVAGLLITEIATGTPAAKGKLRPGDVILSVNNLGVKDKNHYLALIRNYTQADTLRLAFARGGENYSVTLRPMPLKLDLVRSLAVQRWGIVLSNKEPKGRRAKGGVLVQSVGPGSPAAKLGMKPGDILYRIGNKRIKKMDDFANAFLHYRMQLRMLLSVERKGALHNVRMTM